MHPSHFLLRKLIHIHSKISPIRIKGLFFSHIESRCTEMPIFIYLSQLPPKTLQLRLILSSKVSNLSGNKYAPLYKAAVKKGLMTLLLDTLGTNIKVKFNQGLQEIKASGNYSQWLKWTAKKHLVKLWTQIDKGSYKHSRGNPVLDVNVDVNVLHLTEQMQNFTEQILQSKCRILQNKLYRTNAEFYRHFFITNAKFIEEILRNKYRNANEHIFYVEEVWMNINIFSIQDIYLTGSSVIQRYIWNRLNAFLVSWRYSFLFIPFIHLSIWIWFMQLFLVIGPFTDLASV